MFLWLFLLLPLVVSQPCRYAPQFSASSLLTEVEVQQHFLQIMMYWEGQFLQPNPCPQFSSSSSSPSPSSSSSSSSSSPSSPSSSSSSSSWLLADDLMSIGYHAPSGLTLDGHRWRVEDGLPLGVPHLFTAASKESIHVGMIARALNGDALAQLWLSPSSPSQGLEVALNVLARKLNTYESFYENFPAFGGFLPWLSISNGTIVPTSDFASSVPALDNGQLMWALVAAQQAIKSQHAHVKHQPMKTERGYDQTMRVGLDAEFYTSDSTTLLQRLDAYIDRLKQNAVIVFLDAPAAMQKQTVLFRAVSKILNLSLEIDASDPLQAASNYQQPQPTCDNCWLDDPYEGELFTTFAWLYSPLQWTGLDPSTLWLHKRGKLASATLELSQQEGPRNITVQRGWWFSAHEQWKYLYLPYIDSDINWRVFLNGERARTHYSAANNIPGLFASVTGAGATDDANLPYISDCGIQSIAFQTVSNRDIITPYGSFPLFLASPAHALVWYHNMLSAPLGQTCFGSIEGLNITGTEASPLGTHDTKQTTVLAALGGNVDLIRLSLSNDATFANNYPTHPIVAELMATRGTASALDVFLQTVNSEWQLAFPSLEGEDIDFALPTAQVPSLVQPWSSCTADNQCVCNARNVNTPNDDETNTIVVQTA